MSQTQTLPPQKQEQQPGVMGKMRPQPEDVNPEYKGSGKLKDKMTIVQSHDIMNTKS